MGGVLEAILKRIFGLRATFGVDAWMLILKIDEKGAFRHVGILPGVISLSTSTYRLGEEGAQGGGD